MFTQTHILVGAALFARPGQRAIAVAGLLGALVPDLDVWAMFVSEKARGLTGCEIFHFRYWEQPWTTVQAVFNSIPLYLSLLVVALVAMSVKNARIERFATITAVFAGASLLHVVTDFLLHHEDARAQWHPFSDWVFRSPVSYWDPKYYGRLFAVFEIVLAIALVVIVGRRYARPATWVVLFSLLLGFAGPVLATFFSLADHDRGVGSCDNAGVVRDMPVPRARRRMVPIADARLGSLPYRVFDARQNANKGPVVISPSLILIGAQNAIFISAVRFPGRPLS